MAKTAGCQTILIEAHEVLPVLPGMAGESKSYAERLFKFPDIGALSELDATKALRDPARHVGLEFEDDASDG
ncbi:hypothetical protein [Rhodoferax ferrireducens]|uniref:hypothetical protein n=1 Tax=Rhodoferax ferrireducens TaxID=192843 RepID=UPI000E0D4ABC|nr:hypothetical protein [Rhodoferax ferrireducens]